MLLTKLKTIVEYIDSKGRNPFRSWLLSIKDKRTRAIIDARLTRVRLGNLGHTRSVGQGVMELKIDFGPGYRVYFGEDGDTIIVLLMGGSKKTQSTDINVAKESWIDYKRAQS